MDFKDYKTVVDLVVSKIREDKKRNYITLEVFKNEFKDKANQFGVDIEFLDNEKYGYQQALEMYCENYVMQGIYHSWVWDNSGLSVHLHTKEEDMAFEEYWANK